MRPGKRQTIQNPTPGEPQNLLIQHLWLPCRANEVLNAICLRKACKLLHCFDPKRTLISFLSACPLTNYIRGLHDWHVRHTLTLFSWCSIESKHKSNTESSEESLQKNASVFPRLNANGNLCKMGAELLDV